MKLIASHSDSEFHCVAEFYFSIMKLITFYNCHNLAKTTTTTQPKLHMFGTTVAKTGQTELSVFCSSSEV